MPLFPKPDKVQLRHVTPNKPGRGEEEVTKPSRGPLRKQFRQNPKPTKEEIPKEIYDETTEAKRANLQYIKMLEETERLRRMHELEMEHKEAQLTSKANRALARLQEEEEREWRLNEFGRNYKYGHTPLLMEIKRMSGYIQKSGGSIKKFNTFLTEQKEKRNQSELDLAYVHIKEEEERARRIAEDSYMNEKEEEYRKDNFAWTHIKEEEERARRIADDSWQNDMEKDRRQTNKAYTIIAEEKERDRRIAEDEYMKSLEQEYRAENRAWATIATEEERARLLSFGQFPGVPQQDIETHRRVFQETAQQALSKFGKSLEPIEPRTQTTTAPKERHHLNLRKIWVKKEAQPKYKPVPSKPTEAAKSGVAAPKQEPVTRPKVAPSVQQQPTPEKPTDRKAMVDQMTDQLFQKLQTKMGLTQMGK